MGIRQHLELVLVPILLCWMLLDSGRHLLLPDQATLMPRSQSTIGKLSFVRRSSTAAALQRHAVFAAWWKGHDKVTRFRVDLVSHHVNANNALLLYSSPLLLRP